MPGFSWAFTRYWTRSKTMANVWEGAGPLNNQYEKNSFTLKANKSYTFIRFSPSGNYSLIPFKCLACSPNAGLPVFYSDGHERKIRHIEGNAKCHHLKKSTWKETLRQVFIRVYRLEIQSVIGIFDPTLWTITPLTFPLVQVSPLPCVNTFTVYTYTVCHCVREGRYGVLCLRQINTCRKVPLQVIFHWCLYS
jgi:hypothetical protein